MNYRGYITSSRFYSLLGCVFFAFIVILGRLVWLHVIKSDELTQIADVSRKRVDVLNSRRGSIYDCRRNLLAGTRPVVELGIDPMVFNGMTTDRQPVDGDVERFLKLIGMSKSEFAEKSKRATITIERDDKTEVRNVQYRKLVDELDDNVYAQVKELKLKGICATRKYVRYYPGGEMAAHVLGFVNKESTPVLGIERFMDTWLKGQDGLRITERDGRRRELMQYCQTDIPSTDGLNVELSIDWVVQSVVEDEIQRLVELYSPEGISIIVSDPDTGFILAMGNYPSFDLNQFWKYPIENQRNRCVTDVYEPGSTFKIVAVSGAVNEGLFKPNSLVDCGHPIVEYKGRKVKLPSDSHPIGVVPLEMVVSKSSNRGAAMLGMALGDQRMYSYASRFGFGSKTGYGLDGEVSGILHQVKNWDGLTITRLPAGYAIGATPLQVHMAMSAIANGGLLMQPKLIRRIFDNDGRTVLEFFPQLRQRAVRSNTAHKVAAMLKNVVAKGGTAPKAAISGFEAAGKTGTARKIIDGKYSNQHHVASFTGFFPADKPQLAITVVVDDAKLTGPAYGGVVAAPAFSSIGSQLARYYVMSPQPAKDQLAIK
jgi:cell division protein FtsI/penicillin-binding protein 2